MARWVPVVGVAGSDPKMRQHAHSRRTGGHARQNATRGRREKYRHGDAARRFRAGDAVDSCFEAAVELVDDGAMRGVQPRVHPIAGWREATTQMNRHHHGQAEGEKQSHEPEESQAPVMTEVRHSPHSLFSGAPGGNLRS
jgi:hypothetical protein